MAISITDRDGKSHEVASSGVAAGGLTTGIIGTTLGALAFFREGGLGFLDGGRGRGHGGAEDLVVAGLLAENAKLKADIYTDNKFECLQKEICKLQAEVAVERQKTCDNFQFLNYKDEVGKKEILEYVKGHYVPGKLVMPLDAICPPAEPACKPRREFDNCAE